MRLKINLLVIFILIAIFTEYEVFKLINCFDQTLGFDPYDFELKSNFSNSLIFYVGESAFIPLDFKIRPISNHENVYKLILICTPKDLIICDFRGIYQKPEFYQILETRINITIIFIKEKSREIITKLWSFKVLVIEKSKTVKIKNEKSTNKRLNQEIKNANLESIKQENSFRIVIILYVICVLFPIITLVGIIILNRKLCITLCCKFRFRQPLLHASNIGNNKSRKNVSQYPIIEKNGDHIYKLSFDLDKHDSNKYQNDDINYISDLNTSVICEVMTNKPTNENKLVFQDNLNFYKSYENDLQEILTNNDFTQKSNLRLVSNLTRSSIESGEIHVYSEIDFPTIHNSKSFLNEKDSFCINTSMPNSVNRDYNNKKNSLSDNNEEEFHCPKVIMKDIEIQNTIDNQFLSKPKYFNRSINDQKKTFELYLYPTNLGKHSRNSFKYHKNTENINFKKENFTDQNKKSLTYNIYDKNNRHYKSINNEFISFPNYNLPNEILHNNHQTITPEYYVTVDSGDYQRNIDQSNLRNKIDKFYEGQEIEIDKFSLEPMEKMRYSKIKNPNEEVNESMKIRKINYDNKKIHRENKYNAKRNDSMNTRKVFTPTKNDDNKNIGKRNFDETESELEIRNLNGLFPSQDNHFSLKITKEDSDSDTLNNDYILNSKVSEKTETNLKNQCHYCKNSDNKRNRFFRRNLVKNDKFYEQDLNGISNKKLMVSLRNGNEKNLLKNFSQVIDIERINKLESNIKVLKKSVSKLLKSKINP